MNYAQLGELFADKVPTVDPRTSPDEQFELWSIPAYDAGTPDVLLGGEIGSAKKCVQPKDVLLSRIIPHIRRACVVPDQSGRRQIASSEWIVFRNNRFVPDYLRHYLLSDVFHAQFMNTVAGVGGSLLRARPDAVGQIRVPIPSLPEQQRIAAILDQADTLRRKRTACLKLIEALVFSLFSKSFGEDITRSPWPTNRLGMLCELVRGSSPRPQGDPRYFGGATPRLMIADITRDGAFVTPRIDSLTDEGAKRSRPMNAGSVVMAVSGAVGLPAILKVDACIHDGFVGFRSLDQRITTRFLYYWLLRERVRNSSKSTGAIWVNLTTDQVSAFEVPVPPLNEQLQFAERLEHIEDNATRMRAHLAGLTALFGALQHDAFDSSSNNQRVVERDMSSVAAE